ncbi:camphor resistance protein CrcB [Ureibacillus xyleni]|uniref:Fluoride-specific ion channel FluC n=1 Tax=Ureibacillus xyleni TaxID=614648 RepID=A0A285SCB0_9BACL|nr:CrcB family protein [Ureibacillus xyleni]SOC05188.1 camphor resistance protein CrcB [Ureibacillus xyleni]
MQNVIQVFLGGTIGAILRYAIQIVVGTFGMLWIVNVIGSFLLGCLNGYFEKKESKLKLFFTTGMLGTFTTFSTYSESSFNMLIEGPLTGFLFIIGMTLASISAAFLGYFFIRGKKQ